MEVKTIAGVTCAYVNLEEKCSICDIFWEHMDLLALVAELWACFSIEAIERQITHDSDFCLVLLPYKLDMRKWKTGRFPLRSHQPDVLLAATRII